MTYDEALDFIHSIARFGSKPGLRRVTMLLDRLGNPQDKLRFVHVAGTNGKGSTCAMLSSVLTRAGYRTGLYISPFILDFRERIQLDGRMIPREELLCSVERVKREWDVLDALGEPPTEFEVVVAAAMDYYARVRADIVVLEVGMGGRCDATNVIGAPLVSVITSIGFDHTEFLGETLAEIAAEKCGIIKHSPRGGLTVCYPRQQPEALAVIEQRAAETENRLILPMTPFLRHSDIGGSDLRYGEYDLHVPLAGRHQVWNTATVVETLGALAERGFPVSKQDLIRGVAETRFPCRLELLCREPLLLLDGAHNPDGARVLADSLNMLGGRPVHAVVGMLSNKDMRGVLELVLPHCVSVTAVASPDSTKAMPPEELAALAGQFCADVEHFDDGREGVRRAWKRCGRGEALLVFGSLYLASFLRPTLLELAAAREPKRRSAGGKAAPHRKRARK